MYLPTYLCQLTKIVPCEYTTMKYTGVEVIDKGYDIPTREYIHRA